MATCNVPSCPDPFVVVRGSDRICTVLIWKEENCFPFDLTGYTTVKALLPKENGEMMTLSTATGEVAVLSPASAGQITITISDTNSALLRVGERQSFEIEIDKSGEITIVQIMNALSVRPRISC